jgi:VCBS repeat-containing protein
MYVLDRATLTWTALAPTGKTPGDRNSEEGWTVLPDGTLFVVNANTGMASQRYVPSLNQWVDAGAIPVALRDSGSHETGAQVMMYNGAVFAAGAARATGANAVFTPPPSSVDAQSTAQGSWIVAPSFPMKPYTAAPPMTTCVGTAPNLMCQLDDADAPGVALTNGRVLVPAAPGVFNPDSYFFEYDPTNNTLTEVARPANAANKIQYQYHMLLLPNGQVFAPDGSALVQIYTSAGDPNDAWRPTITIAPKSLKPGGTYTISGTQLNGLTEGAYYGDDYSSSTNYPIVRITNRASGHVFWGTTHDRDNLNIAPGAPVTTALDVPTALEPGTSDLVVIANGIPSAPVAVNRPPSETAAASLPTLWPPNGKLVSDVISGTITDEGDSGIDPASLTYTVVDEYGAVQPSGTFTLQSDGTYSFTVPLEASRLGNDKDGRVYTITVNAADNAGNASSITITVTVPHDQGQ